MNKCHRGLLVLSAVIFALETGPIVATAGGQPQKAATRIFPLPEVERPRQICAKNGMAFLLDKNFILVYDLKNGQFQKQIAKKGQGPGELQSPVRMSALSGRLAVQDFNKVKFFSMDGEYLNEIVEPGFQGFLPFLPVGENFVGFPMELQDDGRMPPSTGWIYDRNLKPVKKFYADLPEGPPPPPLPGHLPSGKSDVLMVRDYADYLIDDGKIYVADSRKGLFISVFDENGKLLYEIKPSLGKVKVPKGFLDAIVKERQASKDWDSRYAYENPVSPEYFPDFVGFKIDGGRIYAVRPIEREGFYEVVVMDLKGNLLDRGFRFPLKPDFEAPARMRSLYDVEGGQFIWYEYNDAKEIYELHIR